MNQNSDDEEFYDAIGDENKMAEINQQIQKESVSTHKNDSATDNPGRILNEKSDLYNLSAKTVPPSEKSEENSDYSKSATFPSIDSTEISKTIEALKSYVVPTQKNFFTSLYKKKAGEGEVSQESVKQHNKNFTNFHSLITLQYMENQSKQATNSKKAKGAACVWVAKFSLDNKYLAVGDSEGALKIFNVSIPTFDEHNNDDGEANFQILDQDYICLEGHNGDIIDVSWYKDSKLLLSCSIDKIVILWSLESQRLIKFFEHADIVSSLSFHPLVDEFFASGCFDKIIRIWDINETKVIDWIQTNDIITALTFSPDKNHLLVGFYQGVVKIYKTDQGKLKFMTEVVCKNKFSWGKVNKVGKKVTGILFTEDCEFLVMTNDSRMRLIDFKAFETIIKYKGHTSGKYHIHPSYNNEKELILSGSEDGKVYVWNRSSSSVPQVNPLYTKQKKNRNTSYEYFKPFGSANTTCAIWLPPHVVKKFREKGLALWGDIYVDSIMILFSSDSKIKILGNLANLNQQADSK